jgi:hypothetical protein
MTGTPPPIGIRYTVLPATSGVAERAGTSAQLLTGCSRAATSACASATLATESIVGATAAVVAAADAATEAAAEALGAGATDASVESVPELQAASARLVAAMPATAISDRRTVVE